MMLKEENTVDEWFACHNQSVFYSLSMVSHPNNFSDSLSNAASQSRSQKIQVYSPNRSPWDWDHAVKMVKSMFYYKFLCNCYLQGLSAFLIFLKLMPAQVMLLHDQLD